MQLPKGDGDLLNSFIEECHHYFLLQHVESTNGTGPIYYNAPYCMECFDQGLKAHKKNDVLEEDISMLSLGTPIIALLRVHPIFNEAITIPMRWLTANSCALTDYDWSVRSMGRSSYRIYELTLSLK